MMRPIRQSDSREDTRVAPRISAALIVRNEERLLEACLGSIANEVDEIVVVDTGSADRTKEIADRYGALIFDCSWTGDFAAARNFALQKSSGEWILYIDADERLSVPRPGALREAVRPEDMIALAVRFQPKANFTPYEEVRLFRRDERIRFRGVIHETPRPDIEAVMQGEQKRLGVSDIMIIHVGYDGDMRAKYVRNLPLLEEAVRKCPDRVFYWTDMAEALAGLGRHEEASRACWQAVELASSSPIPKQRADSALAWKRLLVLNREKPIHALEIAARAAKCCPNDHSIKLELARACFAAGETQRVFALVEALMAINADTFADPLTAYDKRIFGEWALDLLGAAHARLGHRAAAADAYGRAAGLAPENLAYRIKAVAFTARSA